MSYSILEKAKAEGFLKPPPRKVNCPIIDMHTHASGPQDEAPLFMEVAALYGITKVVAIARLGGGVALADRYPGRVEVAPILSFEHPNDPDKFYEQNFGILEKAHGQGVRIIKFWFAPRFTGERKIWFDSPLLDPIFDRMAEYGMHALVHVSDPDIWFQRVYTDQAKYGTKADQYPQLENRLREHRSIHLQCAHMGGDPEHLDHLAQLLADHPNLYIDTSATKWIVRELGKQRESARAFFERHVDRILFGTDHVVIDHSEPHRYPSRYWIHQMFWETDLVCELPIEDPDSDGTPMLRGIDLPAHVLEKIYYQNACRVFGITL